MSNTATGTLEIACACGKLRGRIRDAGPAKTTRIMCYCDDCQAFAHAVDSADVLNANGGTEVVQCTPGQVDFAQGREHLASLKLSEKGIVRWYAACCGTPLANTVSAAIPFIAVLRSCIVDSAADEVLGPPAQKIFGRFATGELSDPDVHPKVPLSFLFTALPRILAAKLREPFNELGLWKADGKPVAEPRVFGKG